MKLLDHTLSYFAAILFVIITAWAALFYYNLLDEIYDSLDDGLENYKLLIMQRAASDSTILERSSFGEYNYAIKSMSGKAALTYTDVYSDTLMFMVNEQDFEPVRMLKTVFRHNGSYYELRIINTMVETDDLMQDLLYAILWLYFGLIGSILVVNNFLLKKTWRPFYRLIQQLRNFRLGDQEKVTYDKTNVEEFQVLNDAVAKLIKNSTDTYQSQKQFIENASHELQTPLAISLNKLELLLEQNTLTEEQIHLLAGAVTNLERMKRLNKSLLLLSKIENRQYGTSEEINLNVIVKSLIEDFTDQAEYKNITLSLEETGDCLLHMNPDLATVLLTNLVKNAIVHNVEGGFVKISIEPLKLIIENSGNNQALKEESMFSRFQQGSPHPASSGLGLPIVKAIADLYKFSVTYSFDGTHTLTVHFNRSAS